jgi:DNA-binding response OmpR family regulator
MRPRKRILLAGESEERLSILRFVLDTRGYRVTLALTAEAAKEILRETAFDLLIVDLPLAGAGALIDQAHTLDYPLSALVIAAKHTYISDMEIFADGVMLRDRDHTCLLERIKVRIARKRGPIPKPVASVAALPAAEKARTA